MTDNTTFIAQVRQSFILVFSPRTRGFVSGKPKTWWQGFRDVQCHSDPQNAAKEKDVPQSFFPGENRLWPGAYRTQTMDDFSFVLLVLEDEVKNVVFPVQDLECSFA